MPAIARYASENHERLLGEFCDCGLDNPRQPHYFHDEEKILFSGWVVPLKGIEPKILVKKKGAKHSLLTCNIRRPDVISAKGISVDKINCGFSFALECDDSYEIFFSFLQEEVLVWELTYFFEDFSQESPFRRMTSSWGDLCRRENSSYEFNENELREYFLDLPILKEINQIKKRTETFYSACQIDEESLTALASEVSNPLWAVEAIERSIKLQKLSVPSPFNKKNATCIQSVAVEDFNFLIFSDGDDAFYLVQHCTTICLIFPKISCILALSDECWVKDSRKHLLKVYLFLSTRPRTTASSTPKFLGALIAQRRPYHYFYDYLYGLQLLRKKIGAMEHLKIYSIDSYGFLSPQEIFSLNESFSADSDEDLNEILFTRNGFLISPCAQYFITRDTTAITELDKDLTDHSIQKNRPRKFIGKISQCELNECSPLIWIGISAEKRTWIEQEEGFSNIISRLKIDYPKLGVIVDGRTSTLRRTAADISNIHKEEIIFNNIRENIMGTSIFSSIGLLSDEKIYLAGLCDYFITPYATDSMYPSRICGKPGVVYAPSCMGDGPRNLHIHHKIIEVHRADIIDELPGDSLSPWHAVSYSINWQRILESTVTLMKNYPININTP